VPEARLREAALVQHAAQPYQHRDESQDRATVEPMGVDCHALLLRPPGRVVKARQNVGEVLNKASESAEAVLKSKRDV
jgi:hypothetical protein